MRFGITAHGLPPTPSTPQQRCPKVKLRAMTAPSSSLATCPASNAVASSSQAGTVNQKEPGPAIQYQEPRERSGEQEPQSGIPRTKSVQFSTPDRMATSLEEQSPMGGRGQAESSGDEITPIVTRDRGAAKSYDTTVTSNSRLGDSGVASSQGHIGKGMTRRGSKRRGRKGSKGSSIGAEEGNDEGGWWEHFVEKFGSVELDNKGSVARDHLALERTFLAWLRTSLAFASIGIAITQLFRLNTTISKREGYEPKDPTNSYHLRQLGKPLGATFLGIAILVLAIGGRRYFESQYWIIRGKFPASRGSIFLISFVAVALIVTSLVIVLTIEPSVFEKR